MTHPPPSATWDVIVVGVGAVGSAALYQLAKTGAKVLGLDRFAPPHDRGSSHGETRITRLALGEGAQYVQFALRSHEIWRELERSTGRTLLQQVGALIYGAPTDRVQTHGADDFLQTTIRVARQHDIAHQVLDARAIEKRFPQFRLRGDEIGYFEPEAGYLHPEECIAANLQMARHHGAQVHPAEQVLELRPGRNSVEIQTEHAHYSASRLLLCAGAWLPTLVPALRARAKVYRQVLFWFEPEGPAELFTPGQMPVYIRVPDTRSDMFYGFPALHGSAGGMKLAGEHLADAADPDGVKDIVSDEEIAAMYRLASPHVRISSRCVRASVCKYTVTDDHAFIIDHPPDSDRIWFASACSGHGFKHSAAVGEALAQCATGQLSSYDLAPFSLARFCPTLANEH